MLLILLSAVAAFGYINNFNIDMIIIFGDSINSIYGDYTLRTQIRNEKFNINLRISLFF